MPTEKRLFFHAIPVLAFYCMKDFLELLRLAYRQSPATAMLLAMVTGFVLTSVLLSMSL